MQASASVARVRAGAAQEVQQGDMPIHAPFSQRAIRTPEEVRADMASKGVTVRQVAQELGLGESVVKHVLHGSSKCLRGKSRICAIRLGIVEGVIHDGAYLA